MTATILGITPHHKGAAVQVSGGLNRPPWGPGEGHAALFALYQDTARSLGLELEAVATGGGSDGNFCAALGIPTLDGLGILGAGGHSVDEWVDLDSLPIRAAALATFLASL
jgi:glutamate carboxypeptidase